MGMIVPKKVVRIHLDNDILAGLVRDDVARDHVGRLRRDGAKIYLSPSVVHEMARAGLKTRGQLIDAALTFCDGMTNMQAHEIFEAEIRAAIRGSALPRYPYDDIRRISDLEQVRTDEGRVKVLGEWKRHDQEPTKPQWAAFLDGFVAEIDDAEANRVREFPQYKDFLAHRFGVFRGTLEGLAQPLFAAEGIKMHEHGKIAKRWHNASPMHGLLFANNLISANVYRRAKSQGKASGCMTDLRNIIEAAHGDRFLTRDKDLVASGRLAASVTTKALLRIELVPSP